MAGLKAKLTKRTVDAAQPPATGDIEIWDTELKGFCLRVTRAGTKTYAVKFRTGRAQRWLTIGRHGSPWTAGKARDKAREVLNSAANGEDPAQAKLDARDALTVAELIDAYLADGPATKPAKRASTWANDASNLNRHIRPLLGKKLAHAISQADAARAIKDISDGKTATGGKSGARGSARVLGGEGVARRTRLAAAALWAWGLQQNRIQSANPFSAVKLGAAPERERFLTRDEAGRFLDAVASMEGTGTLAGTFADALRLLLLTGARKTEILGLRWSEMDFGRKLATLPPERTKAGGKTGARRIHLSPPALAILGRRHAKNGALEIADRSPFVFPAARGNGHAIGLRKAFLEVCGAAGLTEIRIHDLRHSFASFALADGASLFLIGKALGHANVRTTERYAHLSGDPLADLAAAVGARIAPEDTGSGTASIAPLPFSRRPNR